MPTPRSTDGKTQAYLALVDALRMPELMRICFRLSLTDSPLALPMSYLRFERARAAFLYVVIEAWHQRTGKLARAYIKASAPDAQVASARLADIERLLAEAKARGDLEKLRSIRDSMFHRDRRDLASIDFSEHLEIALSPIEDAFDAAFLAAGLPSDSTVRTPAGGATP